MLRHDGLFGIVSVVYQPYLSNKIHTVIFGYKNRNKSEVCNRQIIINITFVFNFSSCIKYDYAVFVLDYP